MRRDIPTLSDHPETSHIIGALTYTVLTFFMMPFFLRLLLIDSENNSEIVSIIELVFHGLNFFVAVCTFREYLSDTFDDLRYDWKRLMKTVSLSSGLIFLLAVVLYLVFASSGGSLWLVGYGALPVTEVDLFMLSGDVVTCRPIVGTLCIGLLAPVTVCCLFYASVFSPICTRRPVLAYIVMAAFAAFPRYCNAATFWIPAEQWILYFTQLPVHLIACWSYHKTDSIWAPILTLWIVNLLSCVLNLLIQL